MRSRGRRAGRPLAGAASACLLVLAAAGCGGGGEAGPPTSAVVAANPVTVTVTEVETVTVTVGDRPEEARYRRPQRSEPTEEDVVAIGAAVSEVVAQCQAVAAGFVEGPERDTLERQVAVLANAAGRFDASTPFTAGGAHRGRRPDDAARHARSRRAAPAGRVRARPGVAAPPRRVSRRTGGVGPAVPGNASPP